MADEMVTNQSVNIDRLASYQSSKSFDSGLYMSSQESTANYYSDLLFNGGQGGGPAIVQIDVPAESFNDFVNSSGISVETPVPHPPVPGQTETFVPLNQLNGFNNINGIRFSVKGN